MKKIAPGPGQESVWDYPRPPALQPSTEHVRVVFNGKTLASSNRAYRVLETSHPPVYYIPPSDIAAEYLCPAGGSSFCEWKGAATYYDVQVGERKVSKACWTYLEPTARFESIARYVAFYPSKMGECYVGDEKVVAQPGDFYGGWITSAIVGPFKGGPGTFGW